jgi:hypothetical protein
MKNTIETDNGIITIMERYGKDFKIEMFNPYTDNPNILYAEYSSNFNLEIKELDKIFQEFEPEIIQIMKFNINENIEFYNHFVIEQFLIGSLSVVLIPKNGFDYKINCSKYLKMDLKNDSFEYLKDLADEKSKIQLI